MLFDSMANNMEHTMMPSCQVGFLSIVPSQQISLLWGMHCFATILSTKTNSLTLFSFRGYGGGYGMGMAIIPSYGYGGYGGGGYG